MQLDNNDIAKVTEQVLSEVKTLGDNTKAQHDELKKNYESLKHIVDNELKGADSAVKEKLDKFAIDLTTRQEELDKKFAADQKAAQDRMDAIEIAMKRTGASQGTIEKLYDEAKQFHMHIEAVLSKDGSKGATIGRMAAKEINTDEYSQYTKSFDMFLRTDDRMFKGSKEEKSLLVGSDPDGGYTVTPQMSGRIIQRIYEMDTIRQLAMVETISTGALEMMVDLDQAGAEWESETVATTNRTTPNFNKKRIVVHPLATRPLATQTLLEDSAVNIESWLSNKVGEKFARTEEASFVSGDGIGKPMGFLSYASGTTWGTIQQVNMGAAATLTADGFISVKYSLIEYYLNRGTWLMNRSAVADAMKLVDGTGAYIWKPSAIQADPSSTILGLPVRMSTTMPAVAANALSVALADWREAYLIVDRIGMTVQRDPYTQKPYIEFYFRKRVGGDVVNYDAIKIGKIAA